MTENCVGLNISQDAEEVRLEGYINFFLEEKRVYPNVKRLYIGKNVKDISIKNKMFPNVRKVISDSPYFRSGKMLVANGYTWRNNPIAYPDHSKGTLKNTFCLREDEVIDMSGITHIKRSAFTDCKSTNIINEESVILMEKDAFRGSILQRLPG